MDFIDQFTNWLADSFWQIIAIAIAPIIGRWASRKAKSVDDIAVYLLLALALAYIYKRIPNLPIAWRDVLVAAFIVAALVVFGLWIVLTAIGSVNIRAPFQVFSLLTLILISVNYLSLIVVLGAVFSRCFALVFGSMKGESVNRIRISTTD